MMIIKRKKASENLFHTPVAREAKQILVANNRTLFFGGLSLVRIPTFTPFRRERRLPPLLFFSRPVALTVAFPRFVSYREMGQVAARRPWRLFSLQPHPKIATTTTTTTTTTEKKNIVRRRPGLAFPVEPGLNEGVDCGAVECQEVWAQKVAVRAAGFAPRRHPAFVAIFPIWAFQQTSHILHHREFFCCVFWIFFGGRQKKKIQNN